VGPREQATRLGVKSVRAKEIVTVLSRISNRCQQSLSAPQASLSLSRRGYKTQLTLAPKSLAGGHFRVKQELTDGLLTIAAG
jgi:hypothetical protein